MDDPNGDHTQSTHGDDPISLTGFHPPHRHGSIILTAKDREDFLTPTRRMISRQVLLKSIAELAPRWKPWKMNLEERQRWYKVGEEYYDTQCQNSKDWLLLGRKFENRKMFEEAAQSYSRAIRLNPHCSSYYFRLGCVQCELGEWSGAIESFHIAIALAPEFVRATYYFNLGFAHSELRSWNEAIEALKKAIELKRRKHVYHNLIAVCYRHANEYELSIYHYKHAIALDRIQPAYRRNLAYVYMQLKQWGRAVKTWTGAIQVSPPKNLPELYRNRAFAQAERGYLAVACEDMTRAYELYTSGQQKKRCREKLDRWTSRLQGTEQAYIRAQQQLALERADGGSDGEENNGNGNGGPVKRRQKIRQLAGLIQGEWEEWHGEDIDDESDEERTTESQEEENGQLIHHVPSKTLRGGKSKREPISKIWNPTPNSPQQGRKRLDMVKASRRAPASTLLVKGTYGASMTDEQRFHASSSSAYIRNLIRDTGLDIPFHEKEEQEEKEHARRVRKEAKREERKQREKKEQQRRNEKEQEQQQQRRLDDSSTPSISFSPSHHNGVPKPLDDEGDSSSESSIHEDFGSESSMASSDNDTDDDEYSDENESAQQDSSPDVLQTNHKKVGEKDSKPSRSLQFASGSSSPSHASSATSPTQVGLTRLHSRSKSIASIAVLGNSVSSASAQVHQDTQEEDLYGEDHLDPYSSLSKLFIRLRIDSKYLWRFEQARIHLNNIHLVKEDDMRRVLPPLGPRLTLMNFLQDRITRLRATQGLPLNTSSELELTKTHIEWQRSRGLRRGVERNPQQETEEEVKKITSTICRTSSPTKSPTGAGAIAASRSTLNPVNPSPIVPVSPHNDVLVNRPLSARDRRIIYDAHQNQRSAMSPIRTIGSMNWKL